MVKTELSLEGSLSIEITPDQTEAFLVLSKPEKGAKTWVLPEIQKFIQDYGIQDAKTEELSRQIQKLADSASGVTRIPLAKGQAPCPPVPEEFERAAEPVPPEWKDAVSRTLAENGSVEIFKTVLVKVEKEKTVLKKGPLPFIPAREEKISVLDKETKKEAVEVNPNVLSYAYVREGKKAGTIYGSKQGKSGKSFKGDFLQPDSKIDLSFYLGQNLEKKGSEVFALVEGILRIGSNWADLVPFRDHAWNLSQSDDKATCYLEFHPGSAYLPPPSARAILDSALSLGYKAEELASEADINAYVEESVSIRLNLPKQAISTSQDSFWDILIGEDNLRAVLNVTKGTGSGKPLLLRELGKAINETGLKINKEKVKKDIIDWVNKPDRSLIGYLLAEGRAPGEAPKQTIAFTADFLEKENFNKHKEMILAHGKEIDGFSSFPFDSIVGIAKVEKDQKIVSLGPKTTGTPGFDVYGTPIPGKTSQTVNYQLYGSIELTGTSNLSASASGLFFRAEKDNKHYLALIPYVDAVLNVEILGKGMSAWASLSAPLGLGKRLEKDEIQAALDKLGVKKGLIPEALEKLQQAAAAREEREKICIAQGKEALSGGQTRINWLITFATGQALTKRSDGTVDFRNQDKITAVKKDIPLAELFPPENSAVPGFDVFGNELQAPASDTSTLEVGSLVRQEKNENGVTILVADSDGELKYAQNRLEIVPGMTIKGNIDTSVGNIKFPGSVQISGDVMSGFAVLSGGEIKIAGGVEGALLSSEQDIVIQTGVKGAGKALLRTKKNIMTNFIEMATVLAVGDIKVKKALLRSRIKCNSRVIMPEDGVLVGGEIKVKFGLTAGSVGNQNGVPTKIFFGQDILVEDQIQVEEKEIKNLQQTLTTLNTAMKSSEKLQDKEQLSKLFNEKFKLMKMLEKRNLRLFTLKERFEQHYDSEIIIKGTAWPGTVFESHGRTHEVRKPSKSIKIHFDTSTGRIVESPLG